MFPVIVLPPIMKFHLHFSQGMNIRNGTDVDAGNMFKVFSQLGYKTRVSNDLTVKEIKKLLYDGKFYLSWICLKFKKVL